MCCDGVVDVFRWCVWCRVVCVVVFRCLCAVPSVALIKGVQVRCGACVAWCVGVSSVWCVMLVWCGWVQVWCGVTVCGRCGGLVCGTRCGAWCAGVARCRCLPVWFWSFLCAGVVVPVWRGVSVWWSSGMVCGTGVLGCRCSAVWQCVCLCGAMSVWWFGVWYRSGACAGLVW